VKERLDLETSDNFFLVDLNPVHLNSVFSCTVGCLVNFTSYNGLPLLVNREKQVMLQTSRRCCLPEFRYI